MRARPVSPKRHVAVVAEQSIRGGVFSNALQHAVADRAGKTLLAPAAIRMVEGKKAVFRFATASTVATEKGNRLGAFLCVVSPAILFAASPLPFAANALAGW